MKNYYGFNFLLIMALLINFGCKKTEKDNKKAEKFTEQIICKNSGCEGFYEGPEFINDEDIAHQFSNKMSAKVGEKLKELYNSGHFSRVDLEKIEMSTIGMNSGTVKYKLKIPFLEVVNKCGAFTSFDHVGGWNHKPALKERRIQLQNLLLVNDSLHISALKTTPENLQEYWIQWRNKELQKDCT